MGFFKSVKSWSTVIIISVFVIFLDLWKNYSDVAQGFFKNIIAPIFDDFKFPLVYYLLFFAVLCLLHKDRVTDLKKEAGEEMELLVKANKELSTYRRKEVLHSFLKRFVEAESAVHAVQLYKYTVKKRQDIVIFKIEHVDGFVGEGIELNALEQTYFEVDRQMYRDFIHAKSMWLKADNPKKLIDFVKQYRSWIEALSPGNLLESDAIAYALVQLAVDLIEPYVNQDLQLSISTELFYALNVRKRTGILRAILLENSCYRFSHEGRGEKYGRLYLCQHLNLWGVNHACLLTLDSDILYDDEVVQQMEEIETAFIEGIQNEFKTVYNKDNSGIEGDSNG